MLFSMLCLFSKAQHWAALGLGIGGNAVRCMYVDTSDNTLYVGGNIDYVNGSIARSFAKWTGSTWDLSMSNPWIVSTSCLFTASTKSVITELFIYQRIGG
jgi:hypothetical protein